MKYFYLQLTNWASHVPSRLPRFYLSFGVLLILIFLTQTIKCDGRQRHDRKFSNDINNNDHLLPQTSYLGDELNLYDTTISPENALLTDPDSYLWRQSTPPLMNKIFKRSHEGDSMNQHQYRNIVEDVFYKHQLITPDKVLDNNDPFYVSTADMFSPIFNFQSAKPQLVQQDVQSDSANSFATDSSNLFDTIESGSGAGWPESAPFDENSHRQDESTSSNNELEIKPSVTSQSDQMMTPTFYQMPAQMVGGKYDHAPVLARRLPKLVATVGMAWQYTIPSDTFQDEDGDLRQLNTSLLIMKKSSNTVQQGDFLTRSDLSSKAQDRFFHWLQYDQTTQTLRGFPIENDAGRYFYTLVVSDHVGLMSNETVEIAVRQHPSSRAFTHQFNLSGQLNWSTMKHQSLPDLLIYFSRRIRDEVYGDGSSENVIVRSYSVTHGQPNKVGDSSSNFTSLMTLSWSNSSLSVTRCEVEQICKALIDDRYLNSSWSIFTQDNSYLVPSQNLIKALSPEFAPSSLSVNLRGVCQAGEAVPANQRGRPEDAKTRIGRLKWKLGQPIIYKISDEIFISSDRKDASYLLISLHTIDGLDLSQDPKYDFLQFDQESKTIFGLPYDSLRHKGQRELLLTASYNSSTGLVIRETFIIEIEAQDLTTINNRAFRMVLYFMARTNMFGPKEQVQLSRRMVNALGIEDLSFDTDQASSEFTVINIQKFNTGSSLDNSASLSDPANTWKYQDKIHLVDDFNMRHGLESSASNNLTGPEGSSFYKLTWTNETIGYRGDCPVEVIKDNILYALERSMIDYVPPLMNAKAEDPSTNDSVRFYERLKSYFEPELDLIHLRFEPLSACIDALELHDVGNSDVADLADKASELPPIPEQEISPNYMRASEGPKVKEISPINSDEYWAIVVLIILVVAIIFVVMMLFMGLHTYRINQEKRFELQMKLAQARQNSMYLSSLILSDQVRPSNLVGQNALILPGSAKSMYVEDSSSRKPIILDNEKQFLANGHIEQALQKPTTVQLMGQSVNTTPLKPNMTFTVDSIANLQNSNLPTSVGPETMMANQMFLGNQQRSMTLNRRPTNLQSNLIGRQGSLSQLSQSQSILTVASIGPPTTMVVPNSQANIPLMYTPMPISHDAGSYLSQDRRAV